MRLAFLAPTQTPPARASVFGLPQRLDAAANGQVGGRRLPTTPAVLPRRASADPIRPVRGLVERPG